MPRPSIPRPRSSAPARARGRDREPGLSARRDPLIAPTRALASETQHELARLRVDRRFASSRGKRMCRRRSRCERSTRLGPNEQAIAPSGPSTGSTRRGRHAPSIGALAMNAGAAPRADGMGTMSRVCLDLRRPTATC